MACNAGDACGLTETRSPGCSWSNHSAVMMLTMEAVEAWWPPTLRPETLGRTRLAWSIIAIASHRIRDSTECSTVRSVSANVAGDVGGKVVVTGVSGAVMRQELYVITV